MSKNLNLERKASKLLTVQNTLLPQEFKLIIEKIELANNLKEVWKIFKFIRTSNLKFKSEKLLQQYTIVFVGIFFVLWLIWMISLSNISLSRRSFEGIRYYFFFFFSVVLCCILYGWWIFRKVSYTEQISNSIMLKKVALDNNLVFNKIDKKELMKSFEINYFIFRQGNYSREITTYIKGEYKNKFDYHYFNLHYVDEHTSTSKDANGNESTNTSYNHYDLYGLMIPFNQKKLIKISNFETSLKFRKFIKWKTSSIAFNRKFRVYTDCEQKVAMFLQPKVIEEIEKLAAIFKEMDIELSPSGFLVFSTPDQELLNYSRQYGVDQLDYFQEELKKVLDQTKFYKVLEFISFLKEYCEPA